MLFSLNKNIDAFPYLGTGGVKERRQVDSDRHHWESRVAQLDQEILTEPKRIQQTYQVKAERVEPTGVVYLWPVSS